MPAITASSGDHNTGAIAFMKRMTDPVINAAMEPTDKSMQPEIITKHMPTAMMPIKAVRVSTFMMLS